MDRSEPNRYTNHASRDGGRKLTRRETLRAQAMGFLALSLAASARLPLASAASRGGSTGNHTLTRVKSILEVRGEVHLKSAKDSDSGVRKAPVESKTTLQYEEAFAEAGEELRSVLHFQEAVGTNTVEKHATDSGLRDQARTMIRWCEPGSGTGTVAGVDAPLTEAERQLATSPVATMAVDRLVPPENHRIGLPFELEPGDAARLLNLDAVTAGSLKVVLIDQTADELQLEVSGELSAAARGVPTRIKLTGKAKVHSPTRLISYLALSIEESREIGVAEPGFELTARFRMIRQELTTPQSLQPFERYAAAFEQRGDRLQLVESDQGGYRFLTEDDWVLYKDNAVDAMLRLVRGNRMLAQCNLVNLADMEPGRQLSIDGFKVDIRRSLGSSMGSILEESERKTEQGLRMMRVVAAGHVEGVDLHWVNLLISNDEGRHASVSYTVAAANLEAFGGSDVQLADTFEFTRRLKTAEELAAGKSPEAAKR